jgi:mRNA interferase RelE/StbE
VIEIRFTDDAIDDLRKIDPHAVTKVLQKVLLLETNVEAGHPLGGELTGFRKLVVGPNTWRIVYRVAGDAIEICEIWAIGARADAEVYATAVTRVLAASKLKPHLVTLLEVVDRLGRLAGNIAAAHATTAESVPDWLADRLIYTVGMAREKVAALTLQDAVDLWSDFMSKPVE